ncbi:MAG: PAS domain-containing protein [Phycicoccus sp.]|nr:PAS domain-containing protein [Phycicoccus sp.]NMM35780.1 PAS domain-containing protein [Phycicoccus sp.]
MSADQRRGFRGLPLLVAVQWLGLPLRSRKFWIVQAGVLLVAFLDEIVQHLLRPPPVFVLPPSTIAGLLLVPVVYAALNFGVRGSVSTSLWATVLMFHDWVIPGGVSPSVEWAEIGGLVIINGVAFVVGQRVEREAHARLRAEEALRASEVAEARYRALFDEQHAPVLVTDSAGVVTEANAAATSLLGASAAGRRLSDLVDAPVTAILEGAVSRLPVRERVFVPKARTLEIGLAEPLVQIVLVDVTEEEHRALEQRAYAAHLVTVQEDERRRLARDLHDDPVQSLIHHVRMLKQLGDDPRLAADLVPLVAEGGQLATEVVDVLRTVIRGLRPPALDDLGVVAALRQLVAECDARHTVSVRLRVSGDQIRLSPENELTVYRVAQESLSNVVRHASATGALVDLQYGQQVVLTITDDGCGIPASSTMSVTLGGHLGLIGMRERVNLVGGSLEIRANTPHGTLVRATLLGALPEPQPVADDLMV